MTSHEGRCHCGAIGYVYHCDLPTADWPIRSCQCSFCMRHNAEVTSAPGATIDFCAKDVDALQRYRFALATADFLVCRECGVYIGALIETRDGRFGIVNTCALQPRPADLQPAEGFDYDGEDTEGRIARRERRWSRVGMVP